MPSPWTAHLPQWAFSPASSQQQSPLHPPPAPASSTYSPAQTNRSDALRPSFGFFARFTPRLGGRQNQSQTPNISRPIPPEPMTPWPVAGMQAGLYEAGPGRRSAEPDERSVVEDLRVPEPLFAGQERGAGTAAGPMPPAPVYPAAPGRLAEGEGLPIAFAAEDIRSGAAGDDASTQNHAPGSGPDSRRRRHRRHRHARGHGSSRRQRTHARSGSDSSIYKPRPALRDGPVRLKLLHTVISFLLFLITLIVFLALDAQTGSFSAPFRAVNSLLIVFFAIVFVYSGIRLYDMVSVHRRREKRAARKNAELRGEGRGGRGEGGSIGGGRAVYFDDPEIGLPPPGEPIRVVLQRDEGIGVNDDLVAEDEHVAGQPHPHHPQHTGHTGHTGHAGHATPGAADLAARDLGLVHDDGHGNGVVSESGTPPTRPQRSPKPPPPVYGVWRGSVRADPNLLHWQRVERPGFESPEDRERDGSDGEGRAEGTVHSRPPPSYATQERRVAEDSDERRTGGLEMLPATRYVG